MSFKNFVGLFAITAIALTLGGCSRNSTKIIADTIQSATPTPTPARSFKPRIAAKTDATGAKFKTIGEFATFKWAPPTYTTGFEYDIFYYIPTSVIQHPETKAKSILFMHGGGESTMTREGATWAVSLYAKDFIKIAEEQKLIVVFPSSSGLNWNGHTRVFLRELAKLMRQELPIDPNSIALIGHSMGGMGITRNAFYLGDQFAYIMPVAAGMDPKYMSDEKLLTLFNMPYHHIQGIHDSFEIFVERTIQQGEKMKVLEDRLGVKSQFEATFTNTDHQYNLDQLSGFIKDQFEQSTRNLYQRNLYGSFIYANQVLTDNNIQYNYTSTPGYFWLEAKEFTPADKSIRSTFEAHIKGNQVLVNFSGTHNIKTLRVYLSKKMMSFKKPVSIIINGVRKFHHLVKTSAVKKAKTIAANSDRGFIFDQYVDLNITDSQITKKP